MNSYQELPKKIQRNKIIKVHGNISGLTWSIKPSQNNKGPILINSSGYGLCEGNLKLYIQVIKWLTISINRSAYPKDEQEEIKKLIYNYLKLEVLYKRNEKSRILESIKLDNELLDYVQNMMKKEIEEITLATFGNPEMVTHLKRTLTLDNDILNEEVLRSIVRCNDPELVRKINVELIENKKVKVGSQLSNLKDKSSKLESYCSNFKTAIWHNKILKSKLIAHAAWLGVITAVFIGIGVSIPGVLKEGGSRVYKANIESVSSLGEKENTIDYLRNGTPSRILEVYSETYESDGLYYKDVSSYDFSSFETTSEIEKYFSVDLEFLGLDPINTETVLANNLNEEEYKVLKNITLDLNDKKMLNGNDDKVIRFVLGTLGYILLIYLSTGPAMPLREILKVIEKYSEVQKDKEKLETDKKIYSGLLKEFESFLKSNNIELKDILNFYEETELLSTFDTLTLEEKELIKDYENMKRETEELSHFEYYEELKRVLKKYNK